MIVLGLTGPIGAGKDAVSDYLEEKYGFKTFSCGDVIRRIARERGIEPNRENLQKLGKDCRREEGNGFLGKNAAEMAKKSSSERIAVNGIRSPEEVDELEDRLGKSFFLIYVKAEDYLRFNRLSQRGRTGDPETSGEFEKQDKNDREKFRMEETFSRADIELNNNGTLGDLHRKIDGLVSETIPGKT